MSWIARHLPLCVALACVFYLTAGLFWPRGESGEFDTREFGTIPVLLNGRLKPIDTVARNSLLIIHGKRTFRSTNAEGERQKMSAVEWLLELLYDAPSADGREVFLIHNPEILNLFGKRKEDGKLYAFSELAGHLGEIDQQAGLAAAVEAQLRSPFQRHVIKLQRQLGLYSRLQHSLQHPGAPETALALNQFIESVQPGLEAAVRKENGESYDEEAYETMSRLANAHLTQTSRSYFRPVPPARGSVGANGWRNIGDAAMMAADEDGVSPAAVAYSQLGDAYRAGDAEHFSDLASSYSDWLKESHPGVSGGVGYEAFFNSFSPFYKSMVLYILGFIFAGLFWLRGDATLSRAAIVPLFLALALHAFGLISRMVIEGRPPVTNLYSSAVFVGFGAVVLGSVLELVFRNGIGTATASITGFVTLVIAHHLSMDGDTMEMMRAVLDSNFWLATHVVVITLGYAATFLAGALALVHILRKFVFGQLDDATSKSLVGMVYGTVCFATLFSFVGTILGGIWADQSWGRFWGWDPKENGALLIVLWNAIILHARWGGMIRERGLMVMAVFGNIVTSWSWFGTNMLGIGLHSYGFTDAAFFWLVAFITTQVAFMLIGIWGREWRTAVAANG